MSARMSKVMAEGLDRAHDRVRLAQLPRARGEKHPYESDTQTVQRYFEMTGDCAEAQRLMVN